MRQLQAFLNSDAFDIIVRVLLAALIIFIIVFIYLRLRSRAIAMITYTRAFADDGVYEGDRTILIETVCNVTPLPLFFIDIEAFVYNELQLSDYEAPKANSMQYFISRFHLMPYTKIVRKHNIICKKRGEYNLESAMCYHNKTETYFDAPTKIYVFPKIIPISDIPNPASTEQGDMVSNVWLIEDPFSVSGIRDYHPGDPMNRINHKATARTPFSGLSSIKINNRDFSSARNFMIYLDFTVDPENVIDSVIYEKLMEYELCYCAALLRIAQEHGYRAGFAANCCTVDGETKLRFLPDSSDAHFTEMLCGMAKVRCAHGVSFQSLIALDCDANLSECEVYVITMTKDADVDERLSDLARLQNNITTIVPEVNDDN